MSRRSRVDVESLQALKWAKIDISPIHISWNFIRSTHRN
jgi:hypothetical protein